MTPLPTPFRATGYASRGRFVPPNTQSRNRLADLFTNKPCLRGVDAAEGFLRRRGAFRGVWPAASYIAARSSGAAVTCPGTLSRFGATKPTEGPLPAQAGDRGMVEARVQSRGGLSVRSTSGAPGAEARLATVVGPIHARGGQGFGSGRLCVPAPLSPALAQGGAGR